MEEEYFSLEMSDYHITKEAVTEAYRYMLAIDQSNAAKNMSKETKLSPLTVLLGEAFEAMNRV